MFSFHFAMLSSSCKLTDNTREGENAKYCILLAKKKSGIVFELDKHRCINHTVCTVKYLKCKVKILGELQI